MPTGWKLFRIPLSNFKKVRNIEWNEIRYVRIGVTGLEEEQKTLQIAKMEIVGNGKKWVFLAQILEIAYRASNSGALILDRMKSPNFKLQLLILKIMLITFHLKESRVNTIGLMKFKVKSNH